MSEKLKAFRWLGTSGVLLDDRGRAFRDGLPSGVLKIGTRIVQPGDEVTSQEELAQLGAARIEELVLLVQAQYLSAPKPKGPIASDVTPKERALAEEAARNADERTRFAAILAETDARGGFGCDENGNPTANERARRATMGGGAR